MPAGLVLQCLLHGSFAGRTRATTVGNPQAVHVNAKGSIFGRSNNRPTEKQKSQVTAGDPLIEDRLRQLLHLQLDVMSLRLHGC